MIYLANWKDLVVGKVVSYHQSDHISQKQQVSWSTLSLVFN